MALVVLSAYGRLNRTWLNRHPDAGSTGDSWKLLLVGLAMVIFSFPAYLVLADASGSWRTQLLSGPGTGITLAAITNLTGKHLLRARRHLGAAFVVLFCGAVAVYGVRTSQNRKRRENRVRS